MSARIEIMRENFLIRLVAIHGGMGCSTKKELWYHKLQSGFLTNGHLPRGLCLSDNDKDDKVKPGTVHRSPDPCLTVEENPGKSQLRDRLMKAV